MTELHYAAYCQNLAGVIECVERGLDINQVDDRGYTALAWCVDMGATGDVGTCEAIFDYLVANGASLEFSDERYQSITELAWDCDGFLAEHIERYLTNRQEAEQAASSNH